MNAENEPALSPERAADGGTGLPLCKNTGMSAPDPQPVQRAPLLPPTLLKLLALAFIAGLLVFLLVWLGSRHDNDFYKADGSEATPGATDALPAPLPADVAKGDSASGLKPGASALPAPPPFTAPPPAPAASAQPARPSPAAPSPAASIAGGDLATPVPASMPTPRYPQDALRTGIGGTVKVRVTVATDGSVEALELAEGSGNRLLDRAALEAVRRWTFKPATRNGQAVRMDAVVPIVFNPNG